MSLLGRNILGSRNGMYEAGKLLVYLGNSEIREHELNARGEKWL